MGFEGSKRTQWGRKARDEVSYVLVVDVPKVKSSDGPEQQQRGSNGQRGHSNLQQTRRAGGLHGHCSVCLRTFTEVSSENISDMKA